MDDDREWSRIEQELRRQPAVSRAAIAQIMTRIHEAPSPGPLARLWSWMAAPRFSLSPIGAIGAAVLLVGVAVGVARRTPSSPANPSPPVTRVLASSPGANRQDVQFVLVANAASDVRIVGDFNDWDARATPMQRSGSAGVWSVVVPLAPGRHVYAFVVDGKQWVPDAAAPRAPENEFGTPNSIVMVGGSS